MCFHMLLNLQIQFKGRNVPRSFIESKWTVDIFLEVTRGKTKDGFSGHFFRILTI